MLDIIGDVSKVKEVEAAIEKTLETHRHIDVIHNSAGIAHSSKALYETSENEWDNVVNIYLKSIF